MDERLKTGFPGGVAGAGELHSDVGATAPGVGVGHGRSVPPPPPAPSGDVKKPLSGFKKSPVGSKTSTPSLSGWVRIGDQIPSGSRCPENEGTQDAAPGGVRPVPPFPFPSHAGPVHCACPLGLWPALTEGAIGPPGPRHTSDSRLEKCADPRRVPRSPPRCLLWDVAGSGGPQWAACRHRRAWREGPVSRRAGATRGHELRSSSEREVGAGGGRSQPPAARRCLW